MNKNITHFGMTDPNQGLPPFMLTDQNWRTPIGRVHFLLVTQGCARMEIDGHQHSLDENTFLFLLPNMQPGIPGIYLFSPYIIYLLYTFIVRLYLKEENPIKSLSLSLTGQIYVALPLGLLSYIAYPPLEPQYLLMPYNALMVIAFFTFIWLNDTGAYVVGSLLGKHRLFERISPKKSWEGFIGGVIFTLAAGWVWSTQCSFLSLSQWIGLSAVVAIFSTWGDLCESLLKRTLKVKDSGQILPGHGGLLDRLDSVLLATPAAVIYLYLFVA